jgi:prepilin-type N-terminal cleavage/methylation domain-containing protein
MKNTKLLVRNFPGFSLIELVIAMGIAALVMSGVTMTIHQIIMNNMRNTAHMTAVKQVENALHFMVRDVQMAQVVETDLSGNMILRLSWKDWENEDYQVTYSYSEADKVLTRNHSEEGTTSVCRYLTDAPEIHYENGEVTVNITARVGTGNVGESREINILPRSAY